MGSNEISIVSNNKESKSNNGSSSMVLENLEQRQMMTVTLSTATTTITPPAQASAHFGSTIAANGSFIYIGSYNANQGASGSGCVRQYNTSGTLVRTITKPNLAANDYFGSCVVTTSDGYLLAAAYNANGGAATSGIAYMFNSSGTLVTTFKDPSPTVGENFGCSMVGVGTTMVLIGASCKNSNAGVAYLFDRTKGTVLATYTNPTAGSQYFGSSVAVFGTSPIVADYYDSRTAAQSGAVYMFDGTLRGAVKTAKHTFDNPTPASGEEFGYSISTSATQLLIGAAYDGGHGAAYLYDATTFALKTTYVDPHNTAGDQFGASVALNASRVLIGAPGDNTGASHSGQAYQYDLTGTMLYTLNNPTPAANDNFGASVYLFGTGKSVIEAPGDDTAATDAGAAYLFATT